MPNLNVPVVRIRDLPAPPARRTGWPWTQAPRPLPERREDGTAWPPIGIVTPSYNQGAYLEETIRSVLLQGYPNLEYYIEDGGSTDESRETIQRYARFLSGWVSERDRGQSHAINKGFARLERAEWVTWLNSDDILLPNALRAVADWIPRRRPDAVAVVGRGRHLKQAGRRIVTAIRREDLDRHNLRNWRRSAFLQPACFFSLDAFRKVGGLDESLHLAMDFDLWVKLGEVGEFDLIDAFLARDLHHPDAKTQRAMGESLATKCEILFRRGYPEDARQTIVDLFDEYRYLSRITGRLTTSTLYRKVLQPAVRRAFGAPDHLQPRRRKGKK